MSQGLNKVAIIGHLGRDPERNEAGTVTRFSVGVTERWRDADGNDKEHSEWFQVVCFNGIARACSDFLSRGRQVYVEGRLRTRTYTDRNSEEKRITELLAQTVIFLAMPRPQDEREDPRPTPGAPVRAAKRTGASANGSAVDDDVPF